MYAFILTDNFLPFFLIAEGFLSLVEIQGFISEKKGEEKRKKKKESEGTRIQVLAEIQI